MGSKRAAPSERERFWLDHEAKLGASGLTAKAYCAEHDLSLHAFYQARKRLRKLGLMAAAAPRHRSKPAEPGSAPPVSFSKVEVAAPRQADAEFRLSFPGGVVLEWSGAELPPAVVHLVERLTTPR
jgi:hypothetical protein